ncbi:hypothetical protein [Paraburkholderia humisilvae]|uniref:hypothetical protein n=1 Tax=Paraburkholderia humisilvae TaxID=627669 RepID=UPI001583B21F|nr:hypothetical protein [Paraburkholderia humisilvae]
MSDAFLTRENIDETTLYNDQRRRGSRRVVRRSIRRRADDRFRACKRTGQRICKHKRGYRGCRVAEPAVTRHTDRAAVSKETLTTGLRQDALRNDLLDFKPNVPLQMCGAHSDSLVYFFNTQIAE